MAESGYLKTRIYWTNKIVRLYPILHTEKDQKENKITFETDNTLKKLSNPAMKILLTISVLILLFSIAQAQKKNPADYVNPFIGASTNIEKAGAAHGLGKTFADAATPFGMVQVSSNTITGGDNGPGNSFEQTIEGSDFT